MRFKSVGLTTAVLLVAAAPAAQAKTVHVSGTERGAVISTSGRTTIFAALGKNTLGAYAARQANTVGKTKPNGTVPFTGTFIDYFGVGTEKGKLTGIATPGPNNTAALKGTVKFSGGTGRWKKARGTLTFKGTQATNGAYVVTYTGTISY